MGTKHFVRAFLFILAGLVWSPAHAYEDILVLVRTEVSGTDNVYHYDLVNKGDVRIKDFGIGVVPVPPTTKASPNLQLEPSFGTLTRLPTGTTWGMAPALSPEFPGFPDPRAGWEIPIAAQGSITSPPGWRAEISGIRAPGVPLDAQDLADERYSITWYAPKPVYGGSINVTGADPGQRLAGFSVRVPQDSVTGPGAVGSAVNYTQGRFDIDVWSGSSWLTKVDEKRRGNIFVLTISPGTVALGQVLVAFNAEVTSQRIIEIFAIERVTGQFRDTYYLATFPTMIPVEYIVSRLKTYPEVRYAEPDRIMRWR